jgi:hypothetical protein
MSADIRLLPTAAAPVSQDAVRVLRKALDMAESGELTAVAIAGMRKDEGGWNTWSASENFALLLGAVARMMYRMNRQHDDAR